MSYFKLKGKRMAFGFDQDFGQNTHVFEAGNNCVKVLTDGSGTWSVIDFYADANDFTSHITDDVEGPMNIYISHCGWYCGLTPDNIDDLLKLRQFLTENKYVTLDSWERFKHGV